MGVLQQRVLIAAALVLLAGGVYWLGHGAEDAYPDGPAGASASGVPEGSAGLLRTGPARSAGVRAAGADGTFADASQRDASGAATPPGEAGASDPGRSTGDPHRDAPDDAERLLASQGQTSASESTVARGDAAAEAASLDQLEARAAALAEQLDLLDANVLENRIERAMRDDRSLSPGEARRKVLADAAIVEDLVRRQSERDGNPLTPEELRRLRDMGSMLLGIEGPEFRDEQLVGLSGRLAAD